MSLRPWSSSRDTFGLGDRLRVQLAAHIHVRQRAARHADARGLDAFTATVQALQFSLDGGVGRLDLEGALHVPDGIVDLVLLITDDAHAHVGDKVVRLCRQHA
jgi:hypothetical protein